LLVANEVQIFVGIALNIVDKLIVAIADCDSFSAVIGAVVKASIVRFVWSRRDRKLIVYEPNGKTQRRQVALANPAMSFVRPLP
jgi:hypothetical protein